MFIIITLDSKIILAALLVVAFKAIIRSTAIEINWMKLDSIIIMIWDYQAKEE